MKTSEINVNTQEGKLLILAVNKMVSIGKNTYTHDEILIDLNNLSNKTFENPSPSEESGIFKFTPPELELPYGYKLIKPEYEKAALSIIDEKEFLNSDGITIRQPQNIKKLDKAGVLNLWFYPITKEQYTYISLTEHAIVLDFFGNPIFNINKGKIELA